MGNTYINNEEFFGLTDMEKRKYLLEILRNIRSGKREDTTEEISHANMTGRYPIIISDHDNRYEPFPLTDIQEAYLVGKQIGIESEQVGCHIYFEFEENDLDISRLKEAWDKLIANHDMLHTVVHTNGQQQVLREIPPYRIKTYDLHGKADLEISEHLESIRNSMSHKVYKPGDWPLFDVAITVCNHNRYIIHLSIDEWLVDGIGFRILITQLQEIYKNPSIELPELEITFRDFVLAMKVFEDTEQFKSDLSYWMEKLDPLPPKPSLQYKAIQADNQISSYRQRHYGSLNAEQWSVLKNKAQELKVSPTAILLTVFNSTLASWSNDNRFSILMTYLNRLPLHPQIDDILGPFISTNIFVVQNLDKHTYEENAINHQEQLWSDLEHMNISGIRVIRELKRLKKVQTNFTLPIVFTSMLGLNRLSNLFNKEDTNSAHSWLNRVLYSITQTPQVYLDHQILEQDGALLFFWDVAKDYFEDEVVEKIFKDYCQLLNTISTDEKVWKTKPTERSLTQYHDKQADDDKRYKEFPLTDQQKAYAFGRMVSGISCQAYMEFKAKSLDIPRLNEAWHKVIGNHEMLRATIQSNGTQRILREVPDYEIRVFDIRKEEQSIASNELQKIQQRIMRQEYPLDGWPYFELSVSMIDNQECRIHFSIDLLIADNTSIQQVIKQLFFLYENPERQLKEPDISFREYVQSKNGGTSAEERDESLSYWREKFSEIPRGPQLPMKAEVDERNATGHRRLERMFTGWADLKEKTEQILIPIETVLLTAYLEVISAWSRDKQFTTVVVSWDRPAIHPEIDEVIGDFTNMSWLVYIEDDLSFMEKVKHNHEEIQKDKEHSRVSGLQELRKVSVGKGSLAFPIVFTNISTNVVAESPQNITLIDTYSQTPQVYIDEVSCEIEGKFRVSWDVVEDIFPEGMVEEMFTGYCRLLETLAEEIESWDNKEFANIIEARPFAYDQHTSEYKPQDSNLTREKIMEVPDEWNETDIEYQLDRCLHELIEEQAERAPGNIAVEYKEQRLIYDELNKKANQCAHYIRRLGVGPDRVVGIMMNRSIEMVIGLLAILKAGGAYLPLDPTYPEERLRLMIEDAAVTILLTQPEFKEKSSNIGATVVCLDNVLERFQRESKDNLECKTEPNHLAYVIYTSGSTGQPKGCMISHSAVCNRLLWMQDAYQISEEDKVLQKTPYTFDVSVWEYFWPLLAGARLIVAKPEGHRDSNYLARLIQEEGVTICHFVPSMLRLFMNEAEAEKCVSLRHVFCSGEALSHEVIVEFLGKMKGQVHNLYGPTEAAIDVTYWECEERADRKVPIGRPIANTQIYILDDDLEPVGIGIPGHLYIGGKGLAKGYLNRPELTEERFIPNLFSADPTSKLYKTGDRAQYLHDGNIEFLGRIDTQVKLRGHRIELGEIETILREHPLIEEAAVAIREEQSLDPKLVAYIVQQAGKVPTTKSIRDYVKTKLPEYMVPNLIAPLVTLPINQHGKLDRKALPWPIYSGPDNQSLEVDQEKDSIESIVNYVGGLIKEMLKTDHIESTVDLFDLGVTSFTLVQVTQRISQDKGIQVPVEVFLESPTILSVARYVFRKLDDESSQLSISEADTTPTFIHQDKVIPLEKVTVEKDYSFSNSSIRSIVKRSIPLNVFSGFLSLLKQVLVEGNPKYLYPSAGGLNAVQTYIYIKEEAIEGIREGVYYYHPIEHALYRISDGSLINESIHYPSNRSIYNMSGFCIFFIAQMNAIEPIYSYGSIPLVTLDTGYMSQLLMSKQTEYGIGLYSSIGVDFASIFKNFKLDSGHVYVHCMLGGATGVESKGNYYDTPNITYHIQETGVSLTGHYRAAQKSKDLIESKDEFEFGKFNTLSPEEHERFHEKQVNIRQFSGSEDVIILNDVTFDQSVYAKRSSQRSYLNKKISFHEFSGFLSLIRAETIDGRSKYSYTSPSGLYSTQVYLYVKHGTVEVVDEGLYRYNHNEHTLTMVTTDLTNEIKLSQFPGNRSFYDGSGFSIFLITQLEDMKTVFREESPYIALLEAGYIGQLLMDNQAKFNIGLCPIGGMAFERIRSYFKIENGQELIHSFVGGAFERAGIEDRQVSLSGNKVIVVKEEHSHRHERREKHTQQEMAIIGVSCKYPGANNMDEYWERLKNGERCISRLSDKSRPGSASDGVEGWVGLIDGVDQFDSLLFHISPAEARAMDPQERLMLHGVWTCLEDAGYTSEGLNKSAGKIGVFIGAMWSDYQGVGIDNWRSGDIAQVAAVHSSIANRVSHFFNFNGPSIAVNTSCSSSLTAIHLACASINRGECDAAIVGGINILGHSYHQDILTTIDMLSKDGRSCAFGADGTGWVIGEGAGVILIRPVADSESSCDHIYGIIKGTAVSHIGRALRFGMPNSNTQASSIKDVLINAHIPEESISYVECAAAGASIADAAEITAIKEAFGEHAGSHRYAVGSVKPNIGHAESASGMAQLMKVLLQIKYRQIAPSIDNEPLNPLIKVEDTLFDIVRKLIDWDDIVAKDENGNPYPLRALINGFAATGSSAHLIIDEYKEPITDKRNISSKPEVILLSAATDGQLTEYAKRLHDFLASVEYRLIPISDIAYTLQVGRVHMNERLSIVSFNTNELIGKLADYLKRGSELDGVFIGTVYQDDNIDEVISIDNDPIEVAYGWTKGARIDCEAYQSRKNQRASLPTYPFAKESHWLNRYDYTADYKMPSKIVSSLNIKVNKETTGDNRVLIKKTEDYLKRILSQVSEVQVTKINAKAPLENYGINSLMIVRLNTILASEIGEVSKTLFFEYRNLHELAKYFINNHRESLIELFDLALINDKVNPITSEVEAKGKLPFECAEHTKEVIYTDIDEDIAIIGISGRYPQARNIDEFWENLKSGRDSITEIPKDRWDYRKYCSQDGGRLGKISSKWGGFIEDVDKFDPWFFNISPREAEFIDPQERLFLEIAWHAIEDAGYTRKRLSERKVGVFVGAMYAEYQFFGVEESIKGNNIALSLGYGSIANRVSYFFNLNGPSMAVDTMCSSSLTTLHLASQSFKLGECDMAIVGGVNLSIHPNKYILQSQVNMMSSDGRCRSFGEGGNGLVPGEGVGAVIIKPLRKAQEDKDHIFAVIKSTAVNHDGKTNGYMVPNPNAQATLISDALNKSKIDPRSISYIEAHGTGTALGDPIEITGLTKAFREQNQDKHFCSIGSVKSNIGHLEAAAGIAAITKVILQMKHKKLVPSIHSDKLNSNIDFNNSPFYVQHDLEEWKQPIVIENGEEKIYPRRAGISSFGAGGANAHVIIEEYDNQESEAKYNNPGEQIILLSAKNEERLRNYVQEMIDFLDRNNTREKKSNISLTDIAYTLQVGREQMEERLAFIVSDIQELRDKLYEYLQSEPEISNMSNRDISSGSGNAHLIPEDGEKEEYIKSLVDNNELFELSQLWLSGIDIEWEQLYLEKNRRRIPLPTYPFKRTRCWITETPKVKNINPINGKIDDKVISQKYDGEAPRYTAVSRYYDEVIPKDGQELPIEEIYLTFAPFINRVPSFSWLLPGTELDEQQSLLKIRLSKQQELRNILFRSVDFNEVRNVLDIGCGFSSDIIQLAKRYPHIQCDGYTISPNQAALGKHRLEDAKLDDRIRVFHGDSSNDVFPNTYDLIIGFEVIFHIQNKLAVFQNMSTHLNDDGQIVLADVISNTVTEIDMPHIGQYTCAQNQYVQHLAESGLKISECVDISQQISNFLYDPDFEQHLSYLNAKYPDTEELNNEHRSWSNFGKALEMNLFRYVLLTIHKADSNESHDELVLINNSKLENPIYYLDILKKYPWLLVDNYLSDAEIIANVDERRSADNTDLHKRVSKIVTQVLCDVIGIEFKDVDISISFADYGIDSLLGVAMLDIINRELNIDLKMKVLFDYTCVDDLSNYISTTYRDVLNTKLGLNHIHKQAITMPSMSDLRSENKYMKVKTAENIKKNWDDVAVIGMSGRFPGASNIDEFWKNLIEGIDSITEVPLDRWDPKIHFNPDPQNPYSTYSKWGGFLDDIDKFDPQFFQISPAEAQVIDPQQRLFLEECWHALEDAGYTKSTLINKKCGVFTGVYGNEYSDLIKTRNTHVNAGQAMLGNSNSILSARIAYFLDLKGPVMSIDTSCSSSLVAVHVACRSLQQQEADIMLAGGVSLYLTEKPYIMMSRAGMLSPTGKCQAFDSKADGIVVGEAVGVIVLKLLNKAIADGDHIYGVIKGSGINQDGRTNGITAPSAQSQTALELDVYKQSGINPETITFVEAHGTGTKLGDPIEISALNDAFNRYTNKKQFCMVSSVKNNVGHTSAAAGIVSLIKVLLSLQHKMIPPTLNVNHEDIPKYFSDSPFCINTEAEVWKQNDSNHRRAAISSFGFSGTNCHMVIEEPPSQKMKIYSPNTIGNYYVVPLSAKNEERLKAYAKYMVDFLKGINNSFIDDQNANDYSCNNGGICIEDIAYTLQVGREQMEERIALVVSGIDDLLNKLSDFCQDKSDINDLYRGNIKTNDYSTSLLIDGRSGQEFIKIVIEDRDLTKLAKLWASGVNIDWNLLHKTHKPNRLSLPTYPFNKKRCWITETIEVQKGLNIYTEDSEMHVESIPKQKDHLEEFCYIPQWTLNPLLKDRSDENRQKKELKKSVLIVYPLDTSGLVNALEEGHASDEVIKILLGSETKQHSESFWEVSIGNPETFDTCIKQLENIDTIYFIGGIWTSEFTIDDLNILDKSQNQGILSLVDLVKSLSRYEFSERNIQLKVITNNVHQVIPGEIIIPYSASLCGLTRTLAREYPQWDISYVDINLDEITTDFSDTISQSILDHIIAEYSGNQFNDVAIRNGQRYVRTLQPIILSPVSSTSFVKNGVYLIIGGAGWIGFELSLHLAKSVQARLIWIGRSSLDPYKIEKIAQIESSGGKVLYIQADATDTNSMEKAIKQIKTAYGKINGIFHSAMVFKGELIANIDKNTFKDVIDPKVKASIILYKILKDEDLDFIVFFSSLQSFIGDKRQGNYAAGCTFVDSFSHYYDQHMPYPVKTINWGYWYWGRDAQDLADGKRQLAIMGYQIIHPEEGMKVLERLVVHNVNQILAAKADTNILEGMNVDLSRRNYLHSEETTSHIQENESYPDYSTVARYYDGVIKASGQHLPHEEVYLTFAPLEKKIPGFSWILPGTELDKDKHISNLILAKQQEMRKVLFQSVDFDNVSRVLDVGCGFSTDIIQIAKRYPHIKCDGYTISPNQANLGAQRIKDADLDNRVHIYYRDSSIDALPSTYDLIIGIEVIFHIQNKQAIFQNISTHLNDGGQIVLADVIANTITEVDMPRIGQFTSTQAQYAQFLAQNGLKIDKCVDVSSQMSNYLYDPDFEQHLSYLNRAYPDTKELNDEHRSWSNLGKALEMNLFKYVLLTIKKAESNESHESLFKTNNEKMNHTFPYTEILHQCPSLVVHSPIEDLEKKSTIEMSVHRDNKQLTDKVEGIIIKIMSNLLGMKANELDVKARFAEYGVDSLIGLAILDTINRKLEIDIKMPVLYDYSSIRDLSNYITDTYHDNIVHGLGLNIRRKDISDHISHLDTSLYHDDLYKPTKLQLNNSGEQVLNGKVTSEDKGNGLSLPIRDLLNTLTDEELDVLLTRLLD